MGLTHPHLIGSKVSPTPPATHPALQIFPTVVPHIFPNTEQGFVCVSSVADQQIDLIENFVMSTLRDPILEVRSASHLPAH